MAKTSNYWKLNYKLKGKRYKAIKADRVSSKYLSKLALNPNIEFISMRKQKRTW